MKKTIYLITLFSSLQAYSQTVYTQNLDLVPPMFGVILIIVYLVVIFSLISFFEGKGKLKDKYNKVEELKLVFLLAIVASA